MKVTIPANAISIVEDTGEVYGGWQDPTSETSDARSPDASSSPPPPAAVTSIYTRPTQSISNRGILRFGNDAIQLKDPGLPGTLQQLTLKVNNGTLALGSTDGLCFTTGANGTGSMTVTGTIERLNTAVNGLTYKPKAAYNGTDTLSMLLQGSGVAPCTVSVAIAVYSSLAFTFVDVHLSTPYGATSHLLIPAWHLGKTGSGTSLRRRAALLAGDQIPREPPKLRQSSRSLSGRVLNCRWDTSPRGSGLLRPILPSTRQLADAQHGNPISGSLRQHCDTDVDARRGSQWVSLPAENHNCSRDGLDSSDKLQHHHARADNHRPGSHESGKQCVQRHSVRVRRRQTDRPLEHVLHHERHRFWDRATEAHDCQSADGDARFRGREGGNRNAWNDCAGHDHDARGTSP